MDFAHLIARRRRGRAVVGSAGAATPPAWAHVHASSDNAVRGAHGNRHLSGTQRIRQGRRNHRADRRPSRMSQRRAPRPCPGWTAKLDRDTASGTVRSVTWTAAPNGGIGADQFALFRISVQLPDTDTVSFPATQSLLRRIDRQVGPAAAAGRRRARTSGTHAWRLPRAPAAPHEHHPSSPANHTGAPGSRHRPTTPPACWAGRPWWWPRWVSVLCWCADEHETRRWLIASGRPAVGRHGVDRDPDCASGVRPRHTRVGRARRQRGSDDRSRPGERDLQRAIANHVRRHDGRRTRRQRVVFRGARRCRARSSAYRPAAARTGRDLHGELPGDVRGWPRGVRVVVVSADGARAPARQDLPPLPPTPATTSRSGRLWR